MSNRMRRRPGLVPNLRRTAIIVIFALIAPLYIFGADALAQSVRQLKPTGLTGTVVTAGVQLDWNAPQANADEVTGYQIERRRPAHGETTLGDLVEDTGSTDTTYVDTTATEAGTEYIYRVVARRGNTLSARSNKLVTTWQASEDDETTTRNSFEFVSDTDEELETSAQEAGSVCVSNPDACLPWVKYSERSVPDSSSWIGTRGAWDLRVRRPTFVSGPPANGAGTPPSFRHEYRLWTGRTWGDWVAPVTLGGMDPPADVIEYGAGNWVNVDLDTEPYSCEYSQHRVRFHWQSGSDNGNVDNVTAWVQADGWIYSPCP